MKNRNKPEKNQERDATVFLAPEPVEVLPLNDEADDLRVPCPRFSEDRRRWTAAYLSEFLMEFTLAYFRLEPGEIGWDSDLVDDVELRYLARSSRCRLDEVKYGWIFIDRRKPKATGLSDRGLFAWSYGYALWEVIGVQMGTDDHARTNEAETLGELRDCMLGIFERAGCLMQGEPGAHNA
jgi:hypothetical protein